MSQTPATPTWSSEDTAQRVEQQGSLFENANAGPFMLTAACLRLLQYHFSDASNIFDNALKAYIWTGADGSGAPASDTARSSPSSAIVIEMGDTFDRTKVKCPAVFVNQGIVRVPPSPLINSRPLGGLDASGFIRETQYRRDLEGTVVVECVHNSGLAASRLAEEIMTYFLTFGPAIWAEFKARSFDIKEMSAPKLKDDKRTEVSVFLTLGWAKTYSWTLKPIAPILKKIRFKQS